MSGSEPSAQPPCPRPSGRHSVAAPRRAWYPVARSGELGRPVGLTFMDHPLVAFRGDRGVGVLTDRCPHRNAPLSLGRVRGDSLECGYHGWCFAADGSCTAVPGLTGAPGADTRRVEAWPTLEQDGFVWVWADPSTSPVGEPFPLPVMGGSNAGEVVFAEDLDCTMHAALENALDVPHTAFLHGGIFRGRQQHDVTAVRRDLADGVEVQYLGEPVGMGPFRLGGEATFDHWDRFFLPCVAQIDYRVPRRGSAHPWLRVVNTILHLPLSGHRTRAWFVVRFQSPLPVPVARAVVLGRGRRILAQDAVMLAAQHDTIRRFGGEQFTSTPLDVIGAAVWRLLRQAERSELGDRAGPEEADADRDPPGGEATVTLRV